ncbi:MAG: GIY-YIG nuclease family protein [Candidatus Peribacteraceae bacterium]|nr:GIY-YIG nuclease family protein [Candidatus Peribacteraceae bacterium]
MFYVYLLYSESTQKFYVGFTTDVQQRLASHNGAQNQSTVHGIPWRLVYFEAYTHKSDALIREKKLKNHGKGMQELKKRLTIDEERKGEGGVPR